MGDRAACERAAALLRDVPEPERRAMGPIGLGYLALNQGRLDDADAHYREVHAMSPIGQGLVRWEPEWIETLIRAGRRDEAMAIMEELEEAVAPELLIPQGIGRPKGMLAADDETAAEHFGATVAAAAGRRQLGRRGAHRDHLGRAAAPVPAPGRGPGPPRAGGRAAARASARRCSPSGRRPSCGPPAASSARTSPRTSCSRPHELQVARLVVGGASNRDLAAKLFISPRTVEAHLTAIFRKLGVRNRRELAARAIDDPVLQP